MSQTILNKDKTPLSTKYNIPNKKTIAAMEEGKKLKNDPNALKFDSVDELIKELKNE